MSWIATLNSAAVINGVAQITITFSDDKDASRTFNKAYQIGSPGNDFVKSQSIQEVRNLQALDDYVAGLKVGSDIDLTPNLPTVVEQAAADFFATTLPKFNNLQSSLAKGLIKVDDLALAAVTAEVKAVLALHPEYTTDFRWK